MKSISKDEVEQVLNSPNSTFIDIRDNYIYSLGSIKNAINIPSNFLITMPEKYLNKETKYYIFCDYGVKSAKVVRYLEKLGYDVTNINGGYNDYKE